MEYLRACEKCGKESWHNHGEENQISGSLCKKCYEKWLKFFTKNYDKLTLEYSQESNPSWLAFMNQLPKERVEFT